MNDVISDDDKFAIWLMEMDGAIEEFFKSLPGDLRAALDFSTSSLPRLEEHVLSRYSAVDAIRQPSEAMFLDGAARYVGEVFRRSLGGKWMINLTDQKNAFYARPQLTAMRGQKAQVCPMVLVTAAISRRNGDFIASVFQGISGELN